MQIKESRLVNCVKLCVIYLIICLIVCAYKTLLYSIILSSITSIHKIYYIVLILQLKHKEETFYSMPEFHKQFMRRVKKSKGGTRSDTYYIFFDNNYGNRAHVFRGLTFGTLRDELLTDDEFKFLEQANSESTNILDLKYLNKILIEYISIITSVCKYLNFFF